MPTSRWRLQHDPAGDGRHFSSRRKGPMLNVTEKNLPQCVTYWRFRKIGLLHAGSRNGNQFINCC